MGTVVDIALWAWALISIVFAFNLSCRYQVCLKTDLCCSKFRFLFRSEYEESMMPIFLQSLVRYNMQRRT